VYNRTYQWWSNDFLLSGRADADFITNTKFLNNKSVIYSVINIFIFFKSLLDWIYPSNNHIRLWFNDILYATLHSALRDRIHYIQSESFHWKEYILCVYLWIVISWEYYDKSKVIIIIIIFLILHSTKSKCRYRLQRYKSLAKCVILNKRCFRKRYFFLNAKLAHSSIVIPSYAKYDITHNLNKINNAWWQGKLLFHFDK